MREGDRLNIPLAATDPDEPRQALRYALAAGAPAGAGIHPGTGLFTWAPSNSRAARYAIRATVSDGATPNLSDTVDFSVAVTLFSNSPPTLDSVANVLLWEGSVLRVAAQARDTDLPADTLTFELGWELRLKPCSTRSTGLLTWQAVGFPNPRGLYADCPCPGWRRPSWEASRTFQVAVRALVPGLNLPVLGESGRWSFTFKGEAGQSYQLRILADLDQWTKSADFTLTEPIQKVEDPDPPQGLIRFFRAVPVP